MSSSFTPESVEKSTHDRILEAAFNVIVEKQTTRMSLRQIAKQAGLHYGNLHYYFKSKDELFIALLDYLLLPIIDERKKMMLDESIDPVKKMETLFRRNKELISRKDELRVILDFLLQSNENNSVREKLKNLYQDWRSDIDTIIRQGINRGDYSAQKIILFPLLIISLFDGVTTQYILDDKSVDLDEYFSYIEMLISNLLK